MQWNSRALIPAAVAAVAVMAVATVWMSTRPGADKGRPEQPVEVAVVRAPPITSPHTPVPDTAVVGGPPENMAKADACANCGVVESVQTAANHSRYQMRIRMSNGSLRTVEQAAPLVAGSRVVLQGGVARPAPAGTQG